MSERVVGPNKLFVLGDTRMNSVDSRIPSFGDPDFSAVIGVVAHDDDAIQNLLDELTKKMSDPRSQPTP